MADSQSSDQVIADPTYMADIRFFFRPEDIEHMAPKGIDLGTYDGVKANAVAIFAHTAPPNADMPPDAAGKWSAERSQTFQNWIVNGCPLGTATQPETGPYPTTPPPGARLRKNVTSLGDSEIEALKTAFSGLMERGASDPNGYFVLAGFHGLPNLWCLHHEDRFNPWHRYYLRLFEDALRSVPGCEDVTLPYWDISRSLQQSQWGAYNTGGYQDWSIQAHDGGHGSIGPTMRLQDVASYDPVFWFFHCNLDRLWLSWQTKVGGTTLPGFLTTVSAAHAIFFTNPAFNGLIPGGDVRGDHRVRDRV